MKKFRIQAFTFKHIKDEFIGKNGTKKRTIFGNRIQKELLKVKSIINSQKKSPPKNDRENILC